MSVTVASLAQQCVQESTVVYLDVLRVHSCLYADGDTRSGSGGNLVTRAKQTVWNIGDKKITLEVFQDFYNTNAVRIYSGGTLVSRESKAPRLHDPANVPRKKDSYPLRPGETKEFLYLISDFILTEPRQDAAYSIGMTASFPFRREGEPEGRASSLRQEEANAKKQYVQNPLFEGVRLK